MKQLFFLWIFVLLSTQVLGQKIRYIDSDYILEQMPNYLEAQKKLKQQTTNWQKDIEIKQEALDKAILSFESEKILLTEKQIQKREEELKEQREELNQIVDERFGPTGRLIRLRRNLVKPIQDQVAGAVRKIANKGNNKYGIIFDKGSDLIMVHSDPKYDISELVLNELLGRKRKKK